jgi:hypothetical protein
MITPSRPILGRSIPTSKATSLSFTAYQFSSDFNHDTINYNTEMLIALPNDSGLRQGAIMIHENIVAFIDGPGWFYMYKFDLEQLGAMELAQKRHAEGHGNRASELVTR